MTTPTQHLVDDYLRRLAAATADLPPEVRDDLDTDVRAHVEQARDSARSEADLRTALERLGPPEAIAAEARASAAPATASGGAALAPTPGANGRVAPPLPATSSAGRDVTTLLVVLFGAVALTVVLGFVGTFVGWVVGLGLLWSSRTWTAGEKALGTLVWPGGLVTPFYLMFAGGQVCTSASEVTVTEESVDGTVQTFVQPGTAIAEQCTGFAMPIWLGIPVLVLTLVAPLVVAWLLMRRGDARRSAERTA